jgi:hypothetical protein
VKEVKKVRKMSADGVKGGEVDSFDKLDFFDKQEAP